MKPVYATDVFLRFPPLSEPFTQPRPFPPGASFLLLSHLLFPWTGTRISYPAGARKGDWQRLRMEGAWRFLSNQPSGSSLLTGGLSRTDPRRAEEGQLAHRQSFWGNRTNTDPVSGCALHLIVAHCMIANPNYGAKIIRRFSSTEKKFFSKLFSGFNVTAEYVNRRPTIAKWNM